MVKVLAGKGDNSTAGGPGFLGLPKMDPETLGQYP